MEYLLFSFDDFLKVAPLSEDCLKATQTFPKKDYPRKINEDFQRLARKIQTCLDHTKSMK